MRDGSARTNSFSARTYGFLYLRLSRRIQRRSLPSDRRVYREWYRGIARFNMLKPFVQPGNHVFEVGSGIGCNLKQFESFGCNVRGIEPGEGFSQYSIEKMGLDVRCAFLEDLESEANQDQHLVLLVHVLEHLPDPVDALKRIAH
ncbi:MAG: methyltransferase domain-containing protein [Pirellulaceae bacterium]